MKTTREGSENEIAPAGSTADDTTPVDGGSDGSTETHADAGDAADDRAHPGEDAANDAGSDVTPLSVCVAYFCTATTLGIVPFCGPLRPNSAKKNA